jgi:aspartate/methionine/tyrosine aminotransferase
MQKLQFALIEARLSARLADIEPFRVMDILAQAKAMQAAGRDVIHLEVGEPDFPTPATVTEAGIRALRDGLTHYTASLGLPVLREAIAGYYAERHGVSFSAGRVAVTPGASGALLLAMAALFDPGDEILLADPGYPCNRHFARLVEARGVTIPVGPETGFQLTADTVRRNWRERTRGVLVANPANPTGTLIAHEELQAIHAVVREKGGWLIVDEIYHELVYEASPPSAASLGDDVIVINSFSKYWQMTGWRLGWLIAPEAIMSGIDRLAQNVFLAASTPAQYAALAAFSPESRIILESRKTVLRQRRDVLAPALTRLGFGVQAWPQGAFYVYADIGYFSDDAERFAADLLQQTGVAITPGADFGRHEAGRHVRFAYTTDEARIMEAVERIARFLGQ